MSLLDSKRIIKKVVMLGDSGVGKTSLVRRFVIDEFDDKYVATMGTKVTKKNIDYKLPNRTIYLTMMIWDLLGQREFRKMRTVGLKGTSGVILVADLLNQESILGLVEFWYPQVQKAEGDIPAIVIGNKLDLMPADSGASKQLEVVAGEINAPSFLTSAKTGVNVESAFRALGEIMIGHTSKEEAQEESERRTSLAGAIDSIVTDFCEQADSVSKGMEILDSLAKSSGLNINSPTKENALELIEMMSESEKDRLGKEVSEVNKLRRWRILEDATT